MTGWQFLFFTSGTFQALWSEWNLNHGLIPLATCHAVMACAMFLAANLKKGG